MTRFRRAVVKISVCLSPRGASLPLRSQPERRERRGNVTCNVTRQRKLQCLEMSEMSVAARHVSYVSWFPTCSIHFPRYRQRLHGLLMIIQQLLALRQRPTGPAPVCHGIMDPTCACFTDSSAKCSAPRSNIACHGILEEHLKNM